LNIDGFANTAVGRDALELNSNGTANTAVGRSALLLNTTGSRNTVIGVGALQGANTGDNNTATGVSALQNNTTGYENTATGASALLNNQDGHLNTAVGFNALLSNNVGVGNTAIGWRALQANTAGGNTAVGLNALSTNTDGSNNTAIGQEANVSVPILFNATAIGSHAIVDASNKIRLGDRFVTVIEGQVAFTWPSDRNQKENFRPVDGETVLEKIGSLTLTSWNYIGHDPKQFRHYGPVAQEFFAAFGHDGIGTIGSPTTINSGDMEGILLIAVQALKERTEELGRQLDAVRAKNAGLRAQAFARTAAVTGSRSVPRSKGRGSRRDHLARKSHRRVPALDGNL
jgi:hypothetical protein